MSIHTFNVAEWTPAPLQLSIEMPMVAPPATLFEALTDPHLMCQTFPWMQAIEVENGERPQMGLGSLRRCRFGNGLVLKEEFIGWWPPNGYAIRGMKAGHPFGMRGHVATIWAEARGGADGGSTLIWKHYFDHSNPSAMRETLTDSCLAAIHNLNVSFVDTL